MPKLVLIEGSSGVGKSTVTKYLETIGYSRHSFDDYLRALANAAGYEFRDVLHLIANHGTWEGIGQVDNELDFVRRHQKLSPEEQDTVASSVKRRYLNDRSMHLAFGKNVAADALIQKAAREAILRTNLADRRYLVRLRADPEVAIGRTMTQRAYDRAYAEKLIRRAFDYSVPDTPGLVVLEYENNTPEDLQRIKEELVRALD